MERVYITKVIKIGNSLGFVVPRDITAGLMWERGDQVSFSVIAGPTLVVRQLSAAEIRQLKPARDIKF